MGVKNKSRANNDSKKWSYNFGRRRAATAAAVNEYLEPPVEIPMRARPIYVYGDEH